MHRRYIVIYDWVKRKGLRGAQRRQIAKRRRTKKAEHFSRYLGKCRRGFVLGFLVVEAVEFQSVSPWFKQELPTVSDQSDLIVVAQKYRPLGCRNIREEKRGEVLADAIRASVCADQSQQRRLDIEQGHRFADIPGCDPRCSNEHWNVNQKIVQKAGVVPVSALAEAFAVVGQQDNDCWLRL